MTATTQTVREIALEQPSSIRVFEQYGIDYCCGGRKPLAEACATRDIEVDAVIAALEAAAKGMMTQEHGAAGTLLAEIRDLSHGFTTPEDACPTYHAFYDGLKEFEQD